MRLTKSLPNNCLSHMVTLINPEMTVARLTGIADGNHLHLVMHDVAELKEGYTTALNYDHVTALLDFGHDWYD